MAFELIETQTTIYLRVTGDVAIPTKWGKRNFFPQRAQVRIDHIDGQLRVEHVTVQGPIEKKDGLPGEAWSRDNTYWFRLNECDDAPDLINEVAQAALDIVKEHWK